VTGKFLLVWERTPDRGIAQYNLYREGEWISSVAYDALSIFTDPVADPEKRPYRYEMTITDTCGNESGFTPYHIPIFLQYTGFTDGVNLSWEKYQVEGANLQFSSYSVYKGSDSTQLAPIEENIPPEVSVFIDKDPLATTQTFYYRIAGILSKPCIVSGGPDRKSSSPYTHAISNLDDNRQSIGTGLSGAAESGGTLDIFPNPARNAVTLAVDGVVHGNYRLIISDLTGKVHRDREMYLDGEYSIDISDLEQGYYLVRMIGKEVYSARLVVE
jgi:hypothetical protein